MSSVAIVGAGLAGLAAATHLVRTGVQVRILEGSDDIGGRARSDIVDGFILDRGFQVYNPAYPEGRRMLNHDLLDLQRFAPGVRSVLADGSIATLANPLRMPGSIVATVKAPTGSVVARAKVAAYAARCAAGDIRELERRRDMSAAMALHNAGADKALYENVLRPFLTGVFLEPELLTSRRFLDLVLRSFVRGNPSVPATGMGALAHDLAGGLPASAIQLGSRVERVRPGVVHTADSSIAADAIIVATDAPSAARLLENLEIPKGNSVTTWYHVVNNATLGEPLTGGRGMLTVDTKGPLINSVVMSNVSATYAPAGFSLVSSSALGADHAGTTERVVRAQLSRIYGVDTSAWECIGTYAIPYALPAMTPPFSIRRSVTYSEGVFLAGDHRDTSSIQGALVSGRRAARAVLNHLGKSTAAEGLSNS